MVPNAIFLTAMCLALHVLLPGRYVAYVAAIGICVGLFFYSQGALWIGSVQGAVATWSVISRATITPMIAR